MPCLGLSFFFFFFFNGPALTSIGWPAAKSTNLGNAHSDRWDGVGFSLRGSRWARFSPFLCLGLWKYAGACCFGTGIYILAWNSSIPLWPLPNVHHGRRKGTAHQACTPLTGGKIYDIPPLLHKHKNVLAREPLQKKV